jgi:acetoin utilization deacetylase AcuC-like enzyme
MLHVVHHPDYVVAETGSAHQFSKYQAVMDSLRSGDDRLCEHRPEPMPRRWIEAAHDPAYVDAVFSASVAPEIERRIGFRVTDAVSLRSRLSCGGTWLAAMLAMQHGYAANAAGGSHHASWQSGAGYCVFNDLAVAALRLIDERTVRQILILDCDVHQGDGTAMICAGQPAITTISLHAERNFPVRKAQSTIDVALPDKTGDDDYLCALDQALSAGFAHETPDLILYQAGVDVHHDDKLGRLALSDAGIAARDMMIAKTARERGIPIVSVMGGGYGDDVAMVARRHATTMRTLNAAYFN